MTEESFAAQCAAYWKRRLAQAYPDREITDAEKRRNAGGRHGHYGMFDRDCDQCIEDGS